MKKLLGTFLIVFIFLILQNTTVYAWPNIRIPTIPDFNSILPTITPTPTVSPSQTLEPPPPIDTPVLQKTEENIPVTSTTVNPLEKSQGEKSLSQKDIIYIGVFILLILIILKQSWPGIKKFLHEKTA